MDFTKFMMEIISPLILVLCLMIGYLLKNFLPTDNKIIPVVLFLVGGLCGLIILGLTLKAFIVGAFSGLASTGLHQAFKQWIEAPKKLEMMNLAALGKGVQQLSEYNETDFDKQFAEDVESVNEGEKHNG
nr:MAG TPA: holin [Caudoviricetes sp.]